MIHANDSVEEVKIEKDSKGTIIASGLLGGESIVGVIIAIVMAVQIII